MLICIVRGKGAKRCCSLFSVSSSPSPQAALSGCIFSVSTKHLMKTSGYFLTLAHLEHERVEWIGILEMLLCAALGLLRTSWSVVSSISLSSSYRLSHALLEASFTLHRCLWLWEDCSLRIIVSPALTQDGRPRYTVLRSPYLKRIFCVTLHT